MEDKNFELKNPEYKRAKGVVKYLIFMILLLILIMIFAMLYNSSTTEEYLDYTESASVDYKVYLKDNSYYDEDYQESDEQYVSELVKNIVAEFDYDIEMEENARYNYTYRVEATVTVQDTTTKNSLYSKTQTLVEESTFTGIGTSSINQEVDIDYVSYNKTATSFVEDYSLSTQTDSVLEVKMYIKAENADESVISLSIPLADKTLAITQNIDLVTESTAQLAIVSNNELQRNAAIIGIIICVIGVGVFVFLTIKCIKDTSSEETLYKSEKRKILRSYGSIINKVDNYDIQFDKYYILRLNTFLDLMKIKEDLSKPILMLESKEDTNTIFFIPNDTNFIYMFILGKSPEMLAAKSVSYDDKLTEKVQEKVGAKIGFEGKSKGKKAKEDVEDSTTPEIVEITPKRVIGFGRDEEVSVKSTESESTNTTIENESTKTVENSTNTTVESVTTNITENKTIENSTVESNVVENKVVDSSAGSETIKNAEDLANNKVIEKMREYMNSFKKKDE